MGLNFFQIGALGTFQWVEGKVKTKSFQITLLGNLTYTVRHPNNVQKMSTLF